jgi:hypothetical protein
MMLEKFFAQSRACKKGKLFYSLSRQRHKKFFQQNRELCKKKERKEKI